MPSLNGMTLKIDKAGRVILPKPMRDRLGLREGSDLEIEETAGGIVLKPAERRPSLIKIGSFLVHSGELPPGYDVLKAIEEDREEQTRKALGL
jgi:AbrB family looped-hinge helix DNA binding protein